MREGHTEVAKLLIEKLIENGTPLDVKNKVRARPAYRGPHAPPCATLTRAPYAAQGGRTPLHLASTKGHAEVAKLLIDEGPRPCAKRKKKVTL